MKIEKEVLTLLECTHLQGVGKNSGKAYSFYKIILGDDDYNRLAANIGRDLLVEGIVPDWIFHAAEKKSRVVCDLELLPDDFSCKLNVTAMEPYED